MQLLSGPAHLVEIDLLRGEARFPTAEPLPPAPYFVFLSRTQNRKVVEVWPISLDASLPTVSVPLLPEDTDVALDLQQALTTIYDIIGYDELIDYQQAPPGTLTTAELQWVDERLRLAGRRT